jgi:serine/threonine-protein kinase/endoribonuclease IRE1
VEKIGVYQVCFEERFRIGEGSNETEVFLGLGTDGLEVAIKRVPEKHSNFAEKDKEMLTSQRLVDNANVLNYRFYFETRQYAYIITDLQEETLSKFVLSEDRSVAELQNKGPIILRQILLGINALHDEDILHRDLKPENVLVNFEGKMVVADFGICRQLDLGQTTHKSIQRGAAKWRALESIPTDDDEVQNGDIIVRYKKKSDVQVLGMLFYYVLTKAEHPFGKLGLPALFKISIGESNLSELTDPVAKDLIQWMLQHNITERPTVIQCLKHPYLMSPEENFEFLTAVGNETEIRNNNMENNNCEVVRELNQVASLATPPWSEQIHPEVYDHFTRPGNRYSNNGAELLRFIRNVEAHSWPAPFLQKFGPLQAYFLQEFPTLAMIVHRTLRKYPDWCSKESKPNLEKFF